jgi:hypothetical protein
VAQTFIPDLMARRRYATHFIVNFLPFFAQSGRQRSISLQLHPAEPVFSLVQ